MAKYFDDPIYGFRYFLFVKKHGLKILENLVKDMDATSKNASARTFYIDDYEGNDDYDVHTFTALYFSELFFELDSHTKAGIIAHECYHLLERTLPNIGVSIQYGEYNEHMAYYLTFLVENYMRLIKETE